MMTFIPAWKEIFNTDGGDELIGQIKSVISDTNYQIIINDYLPNLRYFLHSLDLLESNYINLFDELQGIRGVEQSEISLSDLNFPKDSTFIYAPFFIIVYQEEEVIGKVLLGEGGHVVETYHFRESQLALIEIYDDRGFVSSRKIFVGGEEKYTEFLDYNGKWIFKCFKNDGHCVVNVKNSKGLKQVTYESLTKLIFERTEEKLVGLPSGAPIIVSVTTENILMIRKSRRLQDMTLSFFKNRCDISLISLSRLVDVIESVRAVIVDSKINFENIKGLTDREYIHIYKLSPYGTQFELSISQELKEEVIYIEARKVKDPQFLLEIPLTYLIKELSKSEIGRKFELIYRVEERDNILEIQSKINDILHGYFPKEMEILQSDKVDVAEKTVDTQIIELENPNIHILKEVIKSIKVLKINNENELYKLIHRTRLIIDAGEEPDLLTQIHGISAGLPQINFQETEYVQHKKNGLILEEPQNLYEAFEYYLEELAHWQNARTFAVQKIKNYSEGALRNKILEISGGVIHE